MTEQKTMPLAGKVTKTGIVVSLLGTLAGQLGIDFDFIGGIEALLQLMAADWTVIPQTVGAAIAWWGYSRRDDPNHPKNVAARERVIAEYKEMLLNRAEAARGLEASGE